MVTPSDRSIANQTRYRAVYSRGKISEHWANYLSVIVRKMGVEIKDQDQTEQQKLKFGWVRKKGEREAKALTDSQPNKPSQIN